MKRIWAKMWFWVSALFFFLGNLIDDELVSGIYVKRNIMCQIDRRSGGTGLWEMCQWFYGRMDVGCRCASNTIQTILANE